MTRIIDIEFHVPDEKITNFEISKRFPKWTPEKIFDKTGISKRGKSAPEETAADLAIIAAQRLLKRMSIDKNLINMLIFITQTPNQVLPSTSCEIHHTLGLNEKCGSFDINQGCSGYIYGLYLASNIIDNSSAEYILVLTGDTYTKLFSKNDSTLVPIFGDGASATLLGRDNKKIKNLSIEGFEFGTDGSKANYLNCEFGSLIKPKIEWKNLYMNGPGIMTFTLDTIPKVFNSYLNKYSININDIDYVIFHQANKFILERLYKKLNIRNKGVICLEDYGNTVSSSIPIAIKELDLFNNAKKYNILLVGFGVGLSWGMTKIRI